MENNTQDEILDNRKKALDYSIRLLGLRDYSVFKMRGKLKERKHTTEEIDYVIQKLEEYNYLREDEYKRMRIKQLLVKGFSNSYIIRKIAQEELTVHEADINAIRDEQDLGVEAQIDYLVEKKIRYKDIPEDFEGKMKLKKKVMTFLVSKGYGFEEAQRAINRVMQI